MEMEKHARRVPYAPIYSVAITVSATKTPNVLSIPTAHRCASADLVTLEAVLVPAGALPLLSIYALLSDVKMVQLALKTARRLIVYARVELNRRCANDSMLAIQVHV